MTAGRSRAAGRSSSRTIRDAAEIGRVRISTVPTLLQRQGIFSEAVGGRVPQIFDPATTRPAEPMDRDGGMTRVQFPNNTIPAERIDPVARALLDRYPLPTSSATANNYTRVGSETTDQDQFDARIDHRLTTSDRAFARCVLRARSLGAGDAASRRQRQHHVRRDRPHDTKAFALASNYTRIFSDRLINEFRVGYRGAVRERRSRRALRMDRIPDSLPPYRRLSSSLVRLANTFSDFRTDVTHIVNVLSWQRGAHTIKGGADSASSGSTSCSRRRRR